MKKALLMHVFVPAVVGMCGVFLGLLLVHAYMDHVVLHQVVTVLQAAQNAKAGDAR